jgi:hypothetical protein
VRNEISATKAPQRNQQMEVKRVTFVTAALVGCASTAASAQTFPKLYAALIVSPFAFLIGLLVGSLFFFFMRKADRFAKTKRTPAVRWVMGGSLGIGIWAVFMLAIGEPAQRLYEIDLLFVLLVLLSAIAVAYFVLTILIEP